MTPAEAAAAMQRDARRKIELMHRDSAPGGSVAVVQVVGLAAVAGVARLAAQQLRRVSSATGVAIGSPTYSPCRRWSRSSR